MKLCSSVIWKTLCLCYLLNGETIIYLVCLQSVCCCYFGILLFEGIVMVRKLCRSGRLPMSTICCGHFLTHNHPPPLPPPPTHTHLFTYNLVALLCGIFVFWYISLRSWLSLDMSCLACCGGEDTQRAPDNGGPYAGGYPASNILSNHIFLLSMHSAIIHSHFSGLISHTSNYWL